MPHVSKREINRKVLEKLYKNLSKVFSKIENQKDAQIFIDGLLTKTEQIMLAKRLTVIWLLHKNVSASEIEKNIKISFSTIYRISNNYELGKYKKILNILEKTNKSIFEEIHKLLHLGGRVRSFGETDRER